MRIKFNLKNQNISFQLPLLPFTWTYPNTEYLKYPIVCIQLTAIHMPTEWNLIIDGENKQKENNQKCIEKEIFCNENPFVCYAKEVCFSSIAEREEILPFGVPQQQCQCKINSSRKINLFSYPLSLFTHLPLARFIIARLFFLLL